MGREDECPLCCEELSIQDTNFKPCQCGYQICMWCWHHIKNDLNGLCPNCRSTYSDDPHKFNKVDKEEIIKQSRQKKDKKDKKGIPSASDMTRGSSAPVTNSDYSDAGSGQTNFASLTTTSGASSESDHSARDVVDRKSLQNIRVVQRNLIYVIGIPPSIAVEETLRRADYFGQYGRIVKVVVNRNHSGIDTSSASASAYITFAHKEDAKACIAAVDGFYLENRSFRASFGTTKYCNTFLRHMPCSNPDCLYLHEMGDDDDSFTKEQIQSGQSSFKSSQQLGHINGGGTGTVRVSGAGGPSRTGRATPNPVLPPPSYEVPYNDPRALALNPTPPPSETSLPNAAARLNLTTPLEQARMDRSVSMPTGFPPPSSSPPSSSPLQIIGRGQNTNSGGAPGLSNSPFALINNNTPSSSLGSNPSNSLFAGLGGVGGDSWAGGSHNDGLSIAAPSLATPPSSSPSSTSFSLHTTSLDLSGGVGNNDMMNDGFSLGNSAVGSSLMGGSRSLMDSNNSVNQGFNSYHKESHNLSTGPSFDQLSHIWGDSSSSNYQKTERDNQNSQTRNTDRNIFGGLMSPHGDAFGCALFSPLSGGPSKGSSLNSLNNQSSGSSNSSSGSGGSGRFRAGDMTALLATALPPPSPSQASVNPSDRQTEPIKTSQSTSYPISKEAVFGDNVQNINRNTQPNARQPIRTGVPQSNMSSQSNQSEKEGGSGVSSGIAMLQQMLPGVKLTYGEGQQQSQQGMPPPQGFDQFSSQPQIQGFSGSPYQQNISYNGISLPPSQQPSNFSNNGQNNSQYGRQQEGGYNASSIWGGGGNGSLNGNSNNGQYSSIW